MEVVVTSRETIKPSNPTPDHNRHLQLSYLDQLNRPSFIPIIYFYPSNQNNQSISTSLKTSLSHSLTLFYPLAGRLNSQLSSVHCNDHGVPFFQARVKSHLSKPISQSNLSNHNKLLPYSEIDDSSEIPLAIQLNFFQRGGLAIGLCLSHKVVDSIRVFSFVNCWAALARADNGSVIRPRFGLAEIFPPIEHKINTTTTTEMNKQNIVAKTYVFSASTLYALTVKYATKMCLDCLVYPNWEEAVMGFIWSRLGDGSKRPCLVFHEVDLGDGYFGNFTGFAMVRSSMDSSGDEGYGLITQTREAVKGVDVGYVKRLQKAVLQLSSSKGSGGGSKQEELAQFTFISNFKLPVYEADFGWGRPVRVSLAKQTLKNTVILLPTRSGDGIEAVFYFEEEDMARLEADEEFLAFVSPTLVADVQNLSPL